MSNIASQATNKIWETLKLIPCNFFKANSILYALSSCDLRCSFIAEKELKRVRSAAQSVVVLFIRWLSWLLTGWLAIRSFVRTVRPSVRRSWFMRKISIESYASHWIKSECEWMSVWLLLLPRGQSKPNRSYVLCTESESVSPDWFRRSVRSFVRLSWLEFSWVFGFRFWVWLDWGMNLGSWSLN